MENPIGSDIFESSLLRRTWMRQGNSHSLTFYSHAEYIGKKKCLRPVYRQRRGPSCTHFKLHFTSTAEKFSTIGQGNPKIEATIYDIVMFIQCRAAADSSWPFFISPLTTHSRRLPFYLPALYRGGRTAAAHEHPD